MQGAEEVDPPLVPPRPAQLCSLAVSSLFASPKFVRVCAAEDKGKGVLPSPAVHFLSLPWVYYVQYCPLLMQIPLLQSQTTGPIRCKPFLQPRVLDLYISEAPLRARTPPNAAFELSPVMPEVVALTGGMFVYSTCAA